MPHLPTVGCWVAWDFLRVLVRARVQCLVAFHSGLQSRDMLQCRNLRRNSLELHASNLVALPLHFHQNVVPNLKQRILAACTMCPSCGKCRLASRTHWSGRGMQTWSHVK